jgi:N-acetylneuraminate lyase
MRGDGSINLDQIPRMVDHLKQTGITGIYVCGSTGEGMSLTTSERMELTEAFVEATAGEMKVVAQVGHNSVEEARRLAQHAWNAGADVISATAPSYYKIHRVEVLVDTMAHIASAAPDAPFYYYHIPTLTGSSINVTRFMEVASRKLPNLVGLKYTAPLIHEFQACQNVCDARFDVLWGTDEMLLSALVVGATGAIGSTYNVKALWDRRIIAAYESGEMEVAAELQLRAVEFVDILLAYPFHAAVKSLLTRMGIECGPCRLPVENLSTAEESQLHARLDKSVVGEWLFSPASRIPEAGASMRRKPFSRPKRDPSARTNTL